MFEHYHSVHCEVYYLSRGRGWVNAGLLRIRDDRQKLGFWFAMPFQVEKPWIE
jgi:hypothetical protein